MALYLLDKIQAILVELGHQLPQTGEDLRDDQILHELLSELQPFDIAALFAGLSDHEQLQLLTILPRELAAHALDHLDDEDQYRLLVDLDARISRTIIDMIPIDNLVDLIASLHPIRAKAVLDLVSEERKHQVDQHLAFGKDTAGRRMTVSFLKARQDWTVERAVAHFREVGRDVEITTYIYVMDQKGHPVGVASLRDILLSPAHTKLADIMYTKVVTVEAEASQEDAAQLLHQYDFDALPVINETGRIVGVISAEDVMDVIQEEATEDFQRIGGSAPLEESYLKTKFVSLFRSRVGWLLLLFVAESFTGTIMRYFEDVLSQAVVLAFFIPLLIDTGGNSGSQASTLVIRAMALGEIKSKDLIKVVWREARVSVLLGLVMGVAAFARASFLGGSSLLGLTVAITICLIVLVGSTVGAALPLIGKRFGVDPAVFSAPLVTTVADGVGLLIYFKVAVWLLKLG